jgi:hypothetical protein
LQVIEATGIDCMNLPQRKYLASEPGCPEQKRHTDQEPGAQSQTGEVGYTMIIAVQHNTYICMFDEEGQRFYVHIPMGHGIIFSSACCHAGAMYNVDNIRIFLSNMTEGPTVECGG